MQDVKFKREDSLKREQNHSRDDDDRTLYSHSKRTKTETPLPGLPPSSSDPAAHPPAAAAPPKQSINLGLSGKLAAHANTTTGGSILKYQPPADAALPNLSYRLYCFPSASASASASAAPPSPPAPLYIHSQSTYRVGRETSVNDLVIPHHSVSKQHAVLQYRQPTPGTVRLYVLDVGSVNGTALNGRRIEEARFVELRERDVLVFGQSGREYVLLHGESRAGGRADERKDERDRGGKVEGGLVKKRPAWADSDDDDV